MRRDAGDDAGWRGARDSSAWIARDGEAMATAGEDAGAADRELPAPVEAPADSGASPTRGRTSIVLHELWTRVGPADDPFEDRPQLVACNAAAVMSETLNEESVFSIETEACNYITVVQPTRRAIALGDTVKVRLWHFQLSAEEPAEAHAALQLDGMRIFDEHIPIPSPGGLVSRRVEATRAIPAGTPIYFHLHNHGANSWSLVEVSAGP